LQNPAWINGSFMDLAEAKISIEDRGFLLGDGVYEVIRVYNGRPFYLDAHLLRFEKSASAIRIDLPCDTGQISETVSTLVEKSGWLDGYIYMQLTRGSAKRDHLFPPSVRPALVMYGRELDPVPAIDAVEPREAITLPDERWLNCNIKSTNLLPNLLARQQAAEAGAVEAIFFRPEGIVTEGTRSNVFAVIDGTVRTHPATNLILPGITREIVLDILQELAVPVSETAFGLQELKAAEEVWLTSTTMEVNPLKSVDGAQPAAPAPGPVCRLVMEKFRGRIADKCFEDVK